MNHRFATGLMMLTGMMRERIFAGSERIRAVKYQILFMFLFSRGRGLAAVTSVCFIAQTVMNKRRRLRFDCLVREK